MIIYSPGRNEYRVTFTVVTLFLIVLMVVPASAVLVQSFLRDGAPSFGNWLSLIESARFRTAMAQSFLVSGLAGLIATVLAFFAAYGINFTRLSEKTKHRVELLMMLPLFLPSITYGFAVIYSFGRMGLVSQLIGHLPFTIYGFPGLLITNVVYALPPAFLVLTNAMRYVDRRYATVSRVMGDGPLKTFWTSACRPVAGAFISAFVLAFFLAFTDFGIPISIAGSYKVVATELYSAMMGSVPDEGIAAAIAVSMLVPSAVAVWLLKRAERLNFRYSSLSGEPPAKNLLRDRIMGGYFIFLALLFLAVFGVIFVVPFVESWPYQTSFTGRHVVQLFTDPEIWILYIRSLWMSILSAAIGVLVTFAAGMIRARSELAPWCRTTMDAFAMLASTVPGMVLGVGFLLTFSGTPLANTFAILVLSNIAHFFATPYLMSATALSKMNAGWETTGLLMGDSWFKTVKRVILPNARTTLLEMFQTYFVNSMVTISAIIFLAGSNTQVITTKMREFQHFERFDAIFVLSILIFFTNVAVKWILERLMAMDDSAANNGKDRE